MLSSRRGVALAVPLLVLSVAGLTGCGGSGDAPGGGSSLVDKAKTAQICVEVAGSVPTAGDVAAKVAQGSITPAEAEAELQPIATRMKALSDENPSLPIGQNLKQLSDDIVVLQKAGSAAPADAQAAAQSLSATAKSVLADCAGITK
jgi:hypothetical protein